MMIRTNWHMLLNKAISPAVGPHGLSMKGADVTTGVHRGGDRRGHLLTRPSRAWPGPAPWVGLQWCEAPGPRQPLAVLAAAASRGPPPGPRVGSPALGPPRSTERAPPGRHALRLAAPPCVVGRAAARSRHRAWPGWRLGRRRRRRSRWGRRGREAARRKGRGGGEAAARAKREAGGGCG